MKHMKISVVGLGYVGSMLLAGLAHMGHTVIGVGRDKKKLSYYAKGISPFTEPGLNELLSRGVTSKKISITDNHQEAIAQTDLTFVCVATPSAHDGGLEMDITMVAAQQIGDALKHKSTHHAVCFRSTLFCGSTEDTLIPILESASGKKYLRDFSIGYNPEFLREGNAVLDFFNPPFTVIGSASLPHARAIAAAYGYIGKTSLFVKAPLILCSIKEAEALKYACNAYHALKVTFANEIGRIYSKYNVDPSRVMDIFTQDTKLNVSSKYLKPGVPFGGSCLGKDLRVLITQGQVAHVSTPLLSAIEKSNNSYIDDIYADILSLNKKRVGFLGLAFKEHTDDLRESPGLSLVNKLMAAGVEVFIFDPYVLLLKNKDLLPAGITKNTQIIESLVLSRKELFQKTNVIVITNTSYLRFLSDLPAGKTLYTIYDMTHSKPKTNISSKSLSYRTPFSSLYV